MGVIINGGVNIGSGRTLISSPYVPSTSTFSFTFNQEYGSANVTINSIGGFTSTPSFTPTSNVFTFNSTGSPSGTITFSFIATDIVTNTVVTELIQNSVILETLLGNTAGGYTFVFTPIVVSQSDTIQIRTYFSD